MGVICFGFFWSGFAAFYAIYGKPDDASQYRAYQLITLHIQVLCANRTFVKLQINDLEGALQDAEETTKLLALWPVARSAPKKPEKPQRLDPPTLEDHTFRNPNVKKHEQV